MKVFISWSGNESKSIGEKIRTWLPGVLQVVKPYFTPDDIEKGARWNSEISKELEQSEFGILCLTRDNLNSPWLIFESGALSKKLENSNVCPILFGITNNDLKGPLKQFQATLFKKEEMKQLLKAINSKLEDHKLSDSVLENVFEKWWPDLETDIEKILNSGKNKDVKPIRTDRDILEEILGLSRFATKNTQEINIGVHPEAVEILLSNYIKLHNENVTGHGDYQETLDTLQEMQKAIIHIADKSKQRTREISKLTNTIDAFTFKYEKDEEEIPF